MEEDTFNKSSTLLQNNPVYKKVPVLVHSGKQLAESRIIVEYIDEQWPEICPLLPENAHERSVVCFWTKFIDDKVRDMWLFFQTTGEKQEKAIENNFKVFKIIEEQAGLAEGKRYLLGNTIGLADIALGWIVHVLEAMEEIVGVRFIEAHTFPRLHEWKDNFMAHPMIKNNLPDRDRILEYYKEKRDMFVIYSGTHNH